MTGAPRQSAEFPAPTEQGRDRPIPGPRRRPKLQPHPAPGTETQTPRDDGAGRATQGATLPAAADGGVTGGGTRTVLHPDADGEAPAKRPEAAGRGHSQPREAKRADEGRSSTAALGPGDPDAARTRSHGRPRGAEALRAPRGGAGFSPGPGLREPRDTRVTDRPPGARARVLPAEAPPHPCSSRGARGGGARSVAGGGGRGV